MEFKREAGDPVDRLQRETVRRRFARWRDTGTFETLLDDPANGGAGNDVLQMIDSAVI